MRQGAQGWSTAMTLRDGMGRELGGGFRMGNTCMPMADSCECMAKTIQFSSVQSLSCVRLFATPRITARQGSLSITNSRSPPKHMSIESEMPSSHLILCLPFSSYPQSFPASGSFQMSQLSASCGQSIGVSASTSVLPMNTQD